MVLPGRMLRRDVQLGEIEVVRFDVGAFSHGEAHVGEDLRDLVKHLGDRMDAAFRERSEADRKSYICAFAGQAVRDVFLLKPVLAQIERFAHAVFHRVHASAKSFPLIRWQLADLLHQL